MKKFSIEKLPQRIKEKIECITWNDGYTFDEDVLGEVWLKEGYEFGYDGSHCAVFSNRTDLIDLIDSEVVES